MNVDQVRDLTSPVSKLHGCKQPLRVCVYSLRRVLVLILADATFLPKPPRLFVGLGLSVKLGHSVGQLGQILLAKAQNALLRMRLPNSKIDAFLVVKLDLFDFRFVRHFGRFQRSVFFNQTASTAFAPFAAWRCSFDTLEL